uniref:Uncharacterized protein n=1 Tax=Ascaris lumbricoides TaxID=6252 RepID=A0A9J2NZZ9_ASCLU
MSFNFISQRDRQRHLPLLDTQMASANDAQMAERYFPIWRNSAAEGFTIYSRQMAFWNYFKPLHPSTLCLKAVTIRRSSGSEVQQPQKNLFPLEIPAKMDIEEKMLATVTSSATKRVHPKVLPLRYARRLSRISYINHKRGRLGRGDEN